MIQTAVRQAGPFAASGCVASAVLFNGFDSTIGKGIVAIQGALLLALILVGRQPSLREWQRAMPILVPLGLALLWVWAFQLQWLPGMGSTSPPIAPDLFAPDAAAYLGATCLLLAGYFLGHEGWLPVERTLDILVILLCGALLAAMLLVAAGSPEPFDYWILIRNGRLSGTAGNANVTATIAGAAFLLALRRVIEQPVTARMDDRGYRILAVRIACLFLMMIAAVALALTGSRFAALATILLAAAITAGTFKTWRRHWIAVGGSGLILLLILFLTGTTIDRFGDIGAAFHLRRAMWLHYWEIFLASPWHGYGLGAFPALNTAHLSDVSIAMMLSPVNSPHNVALQLLLQGGMVYFALVVAAALLISGLILSHVLRAKGEATGIILLAVLVLLILVAMIDIVLDYSATLMLLTLLAGLLWGRASAPDRRSLGARRPPSRQ